MTTAFDGVPDLDTMYDRETNRRKRNPTHPGTGTKTAGMVKTGSNGILAQLRRSAGRADGNADPGITTTGDLIREDDHVTCEGSRPGTIKLAHDGQKGLVYVLLKKLHTHNPGVEATARTWFEANKDGMSSVVISDVINRLRGHLARPADTLVETMERHGFADDTPAKVNVWAEWRDLASHLVTFGGRTGARFAVDTDEGAINSLAFWWIVPGRDGRYFLRQMIGGHNEPVRVRLAPEAMVAIAKKIMAADPKEAMLRYGREIGACGHCGRTLTNDESRARGIGPVCARGKQW